MKKRILSILLLCCMVLTLLPTAAFAAGEIDEQFTLAPGGTYYFDLSGDGHSRHGERRSAGQNNALCALYLCRDSGRLQAHVGDGNH